MSGLEGHTVTEVRELTDDEYDTLYWHKDNFGGPNVLVLDDDTVLIPSCDPEGNHAGDWLTRNLDAFDDLEGKTIERVSPMARAAMTHQGWGDNTGYQPPVIIFEDEGVSIIPAKDAELNSFGDLFILDDGGLFSIQFD